MKVLFRMLIAVLLIITALSSYGFGNETGFFIFIVLGFIFEAAFWLNLFPFKKRKKG
ncbi:hypothetical protein [Pseudoalteromonas sp. NBT06-2]|uniref:hypothetical protein n=1 Tax=Pseudoalteromonas sp. NBT06-2 TaxID=2025950 RepID=UPI00148316B5|nr:hypothetical protein [Pseudoalteromonas sp. NBT06-2]